MGKRKQLLMTRMTKDQRIKAAVKRQEERTIEEAKAPLKEILQMKKQMEKEQFEKVAEFGILSVRRRKDGFGILSVRRRKDGSILMPSEEDVEIERDKIKLAELRKKFNVG